MELKVTITAPDLSAAIEKLAVAIGSKEPAIPAPEPFVVTPAYVAAEPEPVQDVPQVAEPLPESEPEPEPEATPVQAPAPVEEPVVAATPKKVTLKALCDAGAGLVEDGKMDQVISLLETKYGVKAVNRLDESQYDAFAADLIALGAKL